MTLSGLSEKRFTILFKWRNSIGISEPFQRDSVPVVSGDCDRPGETIGRIHGARLFQETDGTRSIMSSC